MNDPTTTRFIPDPKKLSLAVEPLEPRILLDAGVYTVTPDEQLFIYNLNRAPSNPQAYEDEVALPDGTLAGVTAQPPAATTYLSPSSQTRHTHPILLAPAFHPGVTPTSVSDPPTNSPLPTTPTHVISTCLPRQCESTTARGDAPARRPEAQGEPERPIPQIPLAQRHRNTP